MRRKWSVMPSLLLSPSGKGEEGGGRNDELEGVVHPLLRVRHLRVVIGLDVQGVDCKRVRVVFFT